MAPTETCVVETGIPYLLAMTTSSPVTIFAANPWLWVIGDILWLIVSATFAALRSPPAAIPTATAIIP